MSRTSRSSRRAAVAALGLLLLTGCASTTEQLTQARADADAAVGGAALAVDVEPGRVPPGAVQTAIDDALREVTGAATSVTELDPENATVASRRDAVLAALRTAEDALLAARDDPDSAGDALRQARTALEDALG